MQLIAILLLLSSLILWSLCTVVRLLTPEKNLFEQQQKDSEINRIRYEHTCGVIVFTSAGILAAFALPPLWPIFATAVGYCLLVNILITINQNKLARDMIRQHDEDAIFVLHLGTIEGHAEGNPMKIRLNPNLDNWPLAQIDVGISHYSHPLHETEGSLLSEHFLPRLAGALENREFEPILLAMKNDLTAHGITHPIDIRGWDHHPIIRDFIERIMDARPEQPSQKPPK